MVRVSDIEHEELKYLSKFKLQVMLRLCKHARETMKPLSTTGTVFIHYLFGFDMEFR